MGAGRWYLAGSRPFTWDDVLALNEKGVAVLSRAVLLDPPPREAVPYFTQGLDSQQDNTVFAVLAITVIVVLAGLEVTLLAGAAFAVGARRQARSLGLLAATGGSRTHVRRVVLAGGLVLGLAGAVAGVVVGLVLAAVAMPVLTALADADFGHYDVRPLEVLAIALLGVVTGLLAAIVPARGAGRQDPVVALTGRRGQVRTPKKVPAIGVLVTAVGVGAAALGSVLAVALTTGLNPRNGATTWLVAGLIAGGAVLAQVGLIVTSPAVIGLAARWSRRLPLAGRLALRDAARHRGRSAPAMAAVLTAVTGSTALLLYVASIDARDREGYQPQWRPLAGGLQLTQYDYDPVSGKESTSQVDPARAQALLAPVLPPFTSTVVDATVEGCGGYECLPVTVVPQSADGSDGYFGGGSFSGVPVGDAATLRTVTGSSSPEAARTLQRGGVVVLSRSFVRPDGTVRFTVGEPPQEGGGEAEAREVSLPATYLRVPGHVGPSAVYSPAAAETLGLDVRPSVLLMRFDRVPTTKEEDAAVGALDDAGISTYFSVERGYVSDYDTGLLILVLGGAVITLGASGIATGLAQADARADHATLAAVGAAPRVRRTLAAAQATSIAGLGTALGVAAGFVPATALIGAVRSLDLVFPWTQLVMVVVGVPLLAGVLAGLLTRSRVPLERRLV